MKNQFKLFLTVISLSLIISSCRDTIIETYMANVPVYMTYDEFRSSIAVEVAQDLQNPGKIYFYKNYLFVNEYLKGIHVIDNSTPSTPVNLTFISIPGNVDIAVKDDILYADSFIDLVSLDISNIENIQEVDRLESIFPYTLPPFDENYRIDDVDYEKGIVIDWELKEVTREVQRRVYPMYYAYEDALSSSGTSGNAVGASSFGVGGSMARFSIIEDYLYAIDNYYLNIIDINDIQNMSILKKINVSWNIETIFPYNNTLFIGSQNGMIIYDITDSANPSFISDYWHITSCDPVVVDDTLAYVTLRSGNLCGETNDQLDVINISDLSNPSLVRSYAMENPYGLGIDNKTLFVCDGNAGLKIFDADDVMKISENQIAEFPSIQAFDVIPVNNLLMLIGKDGLYQYDYSDLKNIRLVSSVTISN